MTINDKTIYKTIIRWILCLLLLLTAGAQGVWAQINSLPYFSDFSSSISPFDNGTLSSNSNISNVLAVKNTTATATFTGGYTLRNAETVTISFTAYHGYLNTGQYATVKLYNKANQELVAYTYDKSVQHIVDVSFGGTTADGFVNFPAGSWDSEKNKLANGFEGGSSGRKYHAGSGTNNPFITMTVSGSGKVGFTLKCTAIGADQSFTGYLEGISMDLNKIVITDADNNSDRCIAIDDLSITSQLYFNDYENAGGLTDWTSSVGGRYTPIIAEEGGNHYMTVNQGQRNNNGAVLTNDIINGAALAGEDFTLEFDMKLGRSDRNQTATTFTVFASDNEPLFTLADKNTEGNKWNMTVVGHDTEEITLSGVATGGIDAITWHHYKLSYTSGLLYVIITSMDGATNYKRAGYDVTKSGLSKMTFETKRYYANFAFDNLKVSAYARTNFSVSGKTETYTISSTGDLKQVDEGKTITIEYGKRDEVQLTKQKDGYIGAYALDRNPGTYSRAYQNNPPSQTALPILGTFYKFTPKFNGKLYISGWVDEENASGRVNNVTLQKASDGNVINTYPPSNSNIFTDQLLNVELEADQTYYLYASTPYTANCQTSNTNYPTLFLTGFKFEQTGMNREIKVSDLLYVNGKTQTDGLNRTIPGFDLSFTGGDKVSVVESGTQLKLDNNSGSGDGTMVINLRQSLPTHDAKIHSIVFQVANAASETKVTVNGTEKSIVGGKNTLDLSSDLDHVTIVCTAGNFRFTSFSVNYTGTNDDETHLWLNDSKIQTPTLTFANSHIMRVAGDGQAFTQVPTADPASFNLPLTYTSGNTTIATITGDGTNGQLIKNGEATITATFAATDYFNSANASYTVSNVLKNGESYSHSAVDNNVVRINAYAADADKTLTLTGTHDGSFILGTASSDNKTTANATTVTLTNNSGSDITIERLRIYAKRPVAWLYYEGREDNYAQQMHFLGYTSGPVMGFKVYDIGDPTDPIDLTEEYKWETGAKYVWVDGDKVKAANHGGTFSIENGSFTVGSKETVDEEHPETKLPKITHNLTHTGSTAGYSDLTAEANIFIATPPDEDTYKVWDMTTSVSARGQMDSRWVWDNHGFYQAWLPQYQPILNNTGTTLAGNEGLVAKGELRYYTGDAGLRMNLTRVNAGLKFPVKEGMEVKIVMAATSADVNNIISNVTTLTGETTNSLYIERAGVEAPVTVYFLAKADGVVELRSMDKMGCYVKSITLQVPQIHFEEEIVTVKNEPADIMNVPFNTGDATLTYSIGGAYDLDGTPAVSDLATIANPNIGKVTVTGTSEGYVVVNVTNPGATGIKPKKGSYRLYFLDFRFSLDTYNSTTDEDGTTTGADFPSLDLSSTDAKNNGGEAKFDKLPIGYDKVVHPVTYTMSIVEGSPRGKLIQITNPIPTGTRYELEAYSPGRIRVTATTGRISTSCDVVISGGDALFADNAPIRRLADLPTEGDPKTYYFLNKLPAVFNPSGTTTYTIDKAGDISCGSVTTTSETVDDVTYYYAKIANITGDGGALRVTATNDNNTVDTSDDKTASFVLTIAYPASTAHKWDFYRKKNGLYIGKIEDYDGNTSQTVDSKTVTSSTSTQRQDGDGVWDASWTTDTKWEKVYRKQSEQPRWAYAYSARGNNAFIIEETAGLIIETAQKGFYTDNPHQPSEFGYNLIGLHNKASVTIPQLRGGDYIALNLCRVLPNNGAILSATNVEDLSGAAVNRNFTITRSQIDYQNAGGTVVDDEGARVIPGYYTFRAIADGDVTFTLEDEGYLDILSIEIYNGRYQNTMLPIVIDEPPYDTPPPVTYLKEDYEVRMIHMPMCNTLHSTSVGPAEYVINDQKGNINAVLENVEWVSEGGAVYNKGRLTVNDGYGKLFVRMNNYTSEGRYLIGYTPDYILTVGHPPHQDYPYTWNFENISGGAVKGRGNNAYNNVSSDPYTWTGLGYESYQLDTRTESGSLYVPGATLVTDSRDLGFKGTIEELNRANLGCDEFNGLGFAGQFAFKVAQQGVEPNDVPAGDWNPGVTNELLLYDFKYAASSDEDNSYTDQKSSGSWVPAELDANDGTITFGSPGKRETPADGITLSYTSANYVYKMDGGNTKNALLRPQRPLQEGDVITLHGYSTASVLSSGFSFYAGANDNSYDDLVTINWPSSTATEEQEIVYTVKQGDGLAGRNEVYLCRAGKQYTVYLTEVKITGPDASAPVSYERALTCQEDVTVTIPDMTADHYVYIKSSAEPTVVPSNLTKISYTDDGTDGYDVATNVYKYKVTAAGKADVTFVSGTKIYRIGVTNIMKQMKRVGEGDAWATESRDHAIDYTQTGIFTVNDIKANTVTATSYTNNKVTVRLNEKSNAMPAETGMVLKLPLVGADESETAANVDDFAKAKGHNSLPLFYPPYSAIILSRDAVAFGGTEGNLMKENITQKTFTSEIETIDGVDYVPFIFAERYMKWTKIDNDVTHSDNFINSGNVPVFYRMHLYTDAEAAALSTTDDVLNTLGANKAYMLIRSGNVPDALWKNQASPVKRFIAIEGVSDMEEIIDSPNSSNAPINNAIYSLSGLLMGEDESVLAPGIYIRNGKKIIIK